MFPSPEPVYETVPGSFVPSSALHTMEAPLIPSSPGPSPGLVPSSPGPTSFESLTPTSQGQSYYSSLPPEGASYASFQAPQQGFVGDHQGSQGFQGGAEAFPGGGSLGFLAAGGGSDLAVGIDPLLATSRWATKNIQTSSSSLVVRAQHQIQLKTRWETGSRYSEVPEGRSVQVLGSVIV